jgi:hypothetical protein
MVLGMGASPIASAVAVPVEDELYRVPKLHVPIGEPL